VDYQKPAEVYGTSVPGLGISHERKRQLQIIDDNIERGKATEEMMLNKYSRRA
jgi:hypothetical protein